MTIKLTLYQMYLLDYALGKYEEWHRLKRKDRIRPKFFALDKLNFLLENDDENYFVLKKVPTNIIFELMEKYHERGLLSKKEFEEIQQDWSSLDDQKKRAIGGKYHAELMDDESERWLLHRIIEEVGTGQDLHQMFAEIDEKDPRSIIWDIYLEESLYEGPPESTYQELPKLKSWKTVWKYMHGGYSLAPERNRVDFIVATRKLLEEAINKIMMRSSDQKCKPSTFAASSVF